MSVHKEEVMIHQQSHKWKWAVTNGEGEDFRMRGPGPVHNSWCPNDFSPAQDHGKNHLHCCSCSDPFLCLKILPLPPQIKRRTLSKVLARCFYWGHEATGIAHRSTPCPRLYRISTVYMHPCHLLCTSLLHNFCTSLACLVSSKAETNMEKQIGPQPQGAILKFV